MGPVHGRLPTEGIIHVMALPFFIFVASLAAVLRGERRFALAGGLTGVAMTFVLFCLHATDTLGLTF